MTVPRALVNLFLCISLSVSEALPTDPLASMLPGLINPVEPVVTSPTIVTPEPTQPPVEKATPASTPVVAARKATAITTPLPTIAIPTTLPSPPPPPGAGSSQTAVLSVVQLTGTGLYPFTTDLGSKFTSAMSDILGVPASTILIRNWQTTSKRRALLDTTDSITVGSLAPFSNGIAAASGASILKAADGSGSLQAAMMKEGLPVQSVSLQSAETVVPSNFQPLSDEQTSGGLKLWAWILIAVVAGIIFVLTILLCCCRSCLCCFRAREDETEKLPSMIKYGTKDVAQPYFHNLQTFRKTPGLSNGQTLESNELP